MEIQFQKTVVPYLKTISKQTQSQEQTQQVRIPEAMPDIGKVLAGWGQVFIRGKEWHSDCYHIVGGIKTWVLYEPEDGSYPCCVESWLPFQMKWDIPDADQDGTIVACPLIPGVDARMLSDRKLMVRANVSIQACAMLPADTMLYLPDNLPQDIQVLKNTYPMRLPIEAGEKAFEIEETITLPTVEQPLEALYRYTLTPALIESKLVADKLVLRGIARLQLLYLGTDKRLHNWSCELPFSQYTQLNDQYDSSADAVICFAVTGLEMESNEDGSMVVKAGITAQYTIFDQKQIMVVEDMYSPRRDVKLSVEQLYLPAVLDAQNYGVCAEVHPDKTLERIYDITFRLDVPRLQMEEEQAKVALNGVFQVQGADEEGNLYSENARWESDWSIPIAEDTECYIDLECTDTPQVVGASLRSELQIKAMTILEKPISMVTGGDVGEVIEPNPNRPSLILRRIGEESLWELAKNTGSTVEQIKKTNGLQEEPLMGQMLLIPVI